MPMRHLILVTNPSFCTRGNHNQKRARTLQIRTSPTSAATLGLAIEHLLPALDDGKKVGENRLASCASLTVAKVHPERRRDCPPATLALFAFVRGYLATEVASSTKYSNQSSYEPFTTR